MSIEERVKDVISQIVGVPPDVLLSTTDIIGKFGIDSLDVAEIAVELQEEFNIDVPSEALEGSVLLVGDIVKFIENKING